MDWGLWYQLRRHQCQRQGPYEAPEALQRLSARVFRVEGSRQAKKRPTKFLCRFSGTRGDWTTRLRQSRFIGFRPGKGVPLERWVAMETERPLPVALLYTVRS